MQLRGKTAIVTGAGVRIGRAIAMGLAGAGAKVVVHYGSSAEEAAQTVRQIVSAGGQALAVCADLNRPLAAADQTFSAAREAFGSVEVLVNSAAIFEAGDLSSTSEDQFDRHFNINLKSPFFLCQQFARQLPGDASGHIVNILDWRALRPPPEHLAYALAKSGLAALTKALAVDLGPRVQVNGIAPGPILPAPGASQEAFAARGQRNPLQRTGSPDEIVAAVLFLLQSEFITGEILHVTGGEQL